MAFAAGRKSSPVGESIKRYIGVAAVNIVAVNPNKAQLESIYGNTLDKEPEYIGKAKVGDGDHEVENARIDFIVKTNDDAAYDNGVEFTSKVTFFLRNERCYNKDKTKVQVIDKYGRTAWASIEEAKNHRVPVYSTGPANIDSDYRPCYVGEADLVGFIRTFLELPSPDEYKNGKYISKEGVELEQSIGILENIPQYFKGNFSELGDVVNLIPNNVIKVLFGVRTTDDGKEYQTTYNRQFMKSRTSSYSFLEKLLNKDIEAGAFPNTKFLVGKVREYKIEPTNFNSTDSAVEEELPW